MKLLGVLEELWYDYKTQSGLQKETRLFSLQHNLKCHPHGFIPLCLSLASSGSASKISTAEDERYMS